MHWDPAGIADALERGLARAFARIDEEQAVRGLDGLEELALHPVLERALLDAGFGVHREQRYPADRKRRKQSEGERCDFVLTPDARALLHPEAEATLFADEHATPLDEAYWLEVKTVSQFTPEGPNSNYASQLLSPVRSDVAKLSKDRDILHAGVLIVLFTADQTVAEHDLRAWHERCLDRSLPVASPSVRHMPITDRLGNAHCALALFPVMHL